MNVVHNYERFSYILVYLVSAFLLSNLYLHCLQFHQALVLLNVL